MEILKKEIILSKKSIKFIVKPNKKNYEGYCLEGGGECKFDCGPHCNADYAARFH